VLSDASKRAAYDRFGHAGLGKGRRIRRWRARRLRRFRRCLRRHLQRYLRRRCARWPQRGVSRADLRYSMEITLEQAAEGFATEIRVPSWDTCETCSGSGLSGTSAKTCGTCAGAGNVRMSRVLLDPADLSDLPRHRQGDSGPVRDCNGAGRVKKTDARSHDSAGHRRRPAHPPVGQGEPA